MASFIRPKKRVGCKLPPAQQQRPPGPYKLFIRFPSDMEDAEDTRVHSVTIESDTVSVVAIKARIELLLGLPGRSHLTWRRPRNQIRINNKIKNT